jgi:DNA-directed RNA polymerase specialized sigma24 family protein
MYEAVGVPSGLDELFRNYYGYVRKLVTGTPGIPAQDAEDVAMEIMTRLVERDVIGMFDPDMRFSYDGKQVPAKFRTFLTAQVSLYVRGQRDRLGRQRRRELYVAGSSPLEDDGPVWTDLFGGAEDDLSGLDAAEWIRQARGFLATVPKRSDRDACDLVRLFDALVRQVSDTGSASIPETAARMGVSPAVSGRWLQWLRENLRQQAALSRRVLIGGEPYTLAHVRQAISVLQSVHGQPHVRQPLQRSGSPLWRLDYHKIARYERATFPGVEIPAGDHHRPAPHVLNAVVHHLERVSELT